VRTRRTDDDGFTIVEVIVAMVIIAGVLATALAFLVSGLQTVVQGRQRQTATSLATQAVERLRALPYNTVTSHSGTASPDPTAIYAVPQSGTYVFDADLDASDIPGLTGTEKLLINDVSGRTEDITVGNVTYRVHTYVTEAGSDAFNLTAVVVYSSAVSRGERITVQRSVTYSPAGCLSTAQNPFAAPCQAYFTTTAGQALGAITVTNPDDGTAPIPGFEASAATKLELTLPTTSSTVLVEQTASGTSSAMTSGADRASPVPASTGAQVGSVAVDSDPSTANIADPRSMTTPGQTSAPVAIQGPAGTLRANVSSGDNGRARSAIFAGTSDCVGLLGAGLATGPSGQLRPCSSAEIAQSGTEMALTYLPEPALGYAGLEIPLVTIAPGGTARSVAAQLVGTNADACTGVASKTTGCAFAAANRSMGAVRIGPAAHGGGTAWAPSMDGRGILQLSAFAEVVRVEEGEGGTTRMYNRSGSLDVFTGTGYSTLPLTADATVPVDTVITYTSASGQPVYAHYEGYVIVNAPTLETEPLARTGNLKTDCTDVACSSQYNGAGAVIANFTVTFLVGAPDEESGGTPLTRFGLGVDLGGLLAQASYKAAVDAP
jgi:prepilin-type N-terminal cleavage/methylation domain-containing protein